MLKKLVTDKVLAGGAWAVRAPFPLAIERKDCQEGKEIWLVSSKGEGKYKFSKGEGKTQIQ